MCRARILCRLRLIPNHRDSPKQALKTALQEVISSVKQLKESPSTSQRISLSARLFLERARSVIDLLNAWAKHQTQVKLAALVWGMYHLRKIEGLDKLLDTVPNRLMSPEGRESLLNIICKVARYREAAQFLFRTARKYSIVQQMNAVIIDLPQEAFGNHRTNTSSTTLQDAISRVGGSSYDLAYLCNLLQIGQAKACSQFTHQTEQTLKKAKIHAEVQLVFCLEQEQTNFPPRVICSSKDACFLCNMLNSIHGKFHIPRCHGKLYPGWRLPSTPFFTSLQNCLNIMLQNYAKGSLKTLLARRRKTSYPDPNESTLLTLSLSASTITAATEPQPTSSDAECVSLRTRRYRLPVVWKDWRHCCAPLQTSINLAQFLPSCTQPQQGKRPVRSVTNQSQQRLPTLNTPSKASQTFNMETMLPSCNAVSAQKRPRSLGKICPLASASLSINNFWSYDFITLGSSLSSQRWLGGIYPFSKLTQ